ncbi:MAG TPA: hypothetical protein VER58_11795 [Thermoanaerobaculia bacterium]|nr:hypothetical protein [Thermoanaerobaculia bacterium]
MRLRVIVTAAALVGIAIGSFQPMYLRIFAMDGDRLRAAYTELPYRRIPGLRKLLVDATARTPRGATVALWVPFREWEGGYGYAFRRAPFLMPEQRLVPIDHLGEAQYLVCWHGCPGVAGFVSVWRSQEGELMRR